MAAPDGQFFIQANIKNPAPHHESWARLWETKWKKPCEMGVYPFMLGGCSQDFEPIYQNLKAQGLKEPYDWNTYPSFFTPKAEELEKIALDAEEKGNKDKALEYYIRASTVYRFARFPAIRSTAQKQAWEKSKTTVLKGLALRAEVNGYPPIHEVLVAHDHALAHEGKQIPVFYQLPAGASKTNPVPLMLIITGLDGYRTELCVWCEGWRRNNVATVILEIPGTGDSPADAKDPHSPDRLLTSMFEWIAKQEGIDQSRICVQGFSTGGFYAIRAAHTHTEKIAGAISFGGGCHHVFDRAWLDEVNHLEYPFDLANILAHKWGYGDDVEAFKREGSDRFSLLKDGTLDKPNCARLLLINGTEDEIFPIDDMWVALQHGAPKEARFVPGLKHMGEPESFFIILNWIYKLFGIQANAGEQMRTVPFKPKYA